MNFKVRCIERIGSKYFTKGKIYQVINGMLIDDTGESYSGGRFSSVKEINQSCTPLFELVQEDNMFTKDDLKVNDWCVQKNGDVMRVIEHDEELVLVGKFGYSLVNYLKRDLTCPSMSAIEIEKVYRPKLRCKYQLLRGEYSDGELVFDREKDIGCEPPVKEISVEEATKLLTEKFGNAVRIRVGE